MPVGVPEAEFVDNPEPRCACILLLDTSASMGGDPINALNAALPEFKEALDSDELASQRVETAVITFGGSPRLVQDFATAEDLQIPVLSASGGTPMGAAIELALTSLSQRKQSYRDNGIAYFRPWIVLMTDGAPTDSWRSAAAKVQKGEKAGTFSFFGVAVEGADLGTLGQVCPAARAPLKLEGLKFKELFVWLSSSLTSVSHSAVDASGQLPLEPVSDWAAVDTAAGD